MKRFLPALLIVWILLILFPMAWFTQQDTSAEAVFNATFSPNWVHIVMHMLQHCVLAVIVFLATKKRSLQSFALALGIVLLVGLGQEGMQVITSGRAFSNPEWFDIGVDLAGGLIGASAVLLFWRKPATEKVLQ